MRVVGLTGNAASGKSTVAAFWSEAGVPVIRADDLARRAVQPGTPGFDRVVELFGDGVIGPDGSLDRAEIRSRVFSDAEAREQLEAIVHPEVRRLRDEWLSARRGEGRKLSVVEIPLLFEVGAEQSVDRVVVVHAPESVLVERMIENRELEPAEAHRILAAQMPAREKRDRADDVLVNDGSLAELRRKATALLRELREWAGDPTPTPDPDDAAPAALEESSALGPPGSATWGAGSMVLDLHLHTVGSWDCLSDPLRILGHAESRGIDRIAITDHDRIEVALRMHREFPDRIIPGEEVKTEEGIDVIGLYLTELIPGGIPAKETIRRIREQGGVPYLPHPYAGGKGGGGRYAEELAPLVEVVEVFNARLHPAEKNRPAESLALRHGKLRGAGSDAHTVGEVGGVRVTVPAHPNRPDAFRQALEHARIEGAEASRMVHLASTWAKIRKKLPGAPTP